MKWIEERREGIHPWDLIKFLAEILLPQAANEYPSFWNWVPPEEEAIISLFEE